MLVCNNLAWTGVMEVRAATILQDDEPSSNSDHYSGNVGGYAYGSAESTAFKFGTEDVFNNGNGSAGHNTNFGVGAVRQNTFRIAAILQDEDRNNAQEGYKDTVITNYWNSWWRTRYAFGTEGEVTPIVEYHNVPHEAAPKSAKYPNGHTDTSFANVLKNYGSTSLKNGQVTEIAIPSASSLADVVEVRQTLKPSADDQYILIEYTALNKSGNTVDFWIGNESDTMLHKSDDCPIIMTEQTGSGNREQGFLMIASHGSKGQTKNADEKKYAMSDFKLLTYAPEELGLDIGMESRGAGDPSHMRSWVGQWMMTPRLFHNLQDVNNIPGTSNGVRHEAFIFAKSKPAFANVYDSAAAFSAYMNLLPGESKTARFAVRMRTSVYYVDETYIPTAGLESNGFISRPFTSIQAAMQGMKDAGVKKGYIALQSDVTMNQKVVIPDGLDVTLTTTEFSRPNKTPSPVDYFSNATQAKPYQEERYKIIRGNTLTDSMFVLESNRSKLTIGDITIDGANVVAEKPLIQASAGQVRTRNRSIIKNVFMESNDKLGSVIDITGSATLELRDGEIYDNHSALGGAAIRLANQMGGETAIIGGKVKVGYKTGSLGLEMAQNVIGTGTEKANILLETTNRILVDKNFPLDTTARLGLATSNPPTTSTMGTIAITYQGDLVPYSGMNFFPDYNGTSISSGITANEETYPFGVDNHQDENKMYITADMYGLNVFYVDHEGRPMAGATTISRPNVAAGSPLHIMLPSIPGYRFDAAGTRVLNNILANAPLMIHNRIMIDENGNISGSMPTQNTNITIQYKRDGHQYYFDPNNGGAIIEKYEPIVSSATSSSLGMLPTPVRDGYDFVGWFRFIDKPETGSILGNGRYDIGEEVLPEEPLLNYILPNGVIPASIGYYYAKWTPGSGTYDLKKEYKNSSTTPNITFGTIVTPMRLMENVNELPILIPGYRYLHISKTPSNTPTLHITESTGAVTGTMPAFGVNLLYRYQVDANVYFKLKVIHKDSLGNRIGSGEVESLYNAEDAIVVEKENIPGYHYNDIAITQGAIGDSSGYILGLEGSLLTLMDHANGKITGYMPNQDVVIEIQYNSLANPGITRRFVDRERLSKPLFGDFTNISSGAVVDLPFPSAEPKLYGYLFGANSEVIQTPNAALNVDALGNLSGNMPVSGGVFADFRLEKDMDKWQRVHFDLTTDSQGLGTLSHTISPNPILLDDGVSPGHENATKFATLKKDGSLPEVDVKPYYIVEGWYEDSAGTDPMEDTETLRVPAMGTEKTIYVKIIEDPDKWFDITFRAGSNGSIAPVPVSAHVHEDQLWGSLVQSTPLINGDLPIATPMENYNFIGWYYGNIPMKPNSVIQRGVYTAMFSKDASIWGLDPGAFTGTGHIGFDGSGEIHIHGVKKDNIYIVVDPDNIIVGVLQGREHNTLVFPGLVPGRVYRTYEGTPDTVAEIGKNESDIAGTEISSPNNVIVPSIDNNRAVGIDPNNPEMAEIVINPADIDADYGLISPEGSIIEYNGSAWVSPKGNQPPVVHFDNLIPGESYTVVARKKNNESETWVGNQVAGVIVVANPGDMVEFTKFIIQTKTNGIGANAIITEVNGVSMMTNEFAEAHDLESFSLYADITDSQGNPFLYWQVMNGRIPGVTGRIYTNEYTGTMTKSNVVFKAIYDIGHFDNEGKQIPAVEQKIHHGGEGEFAIDPNTIADLEKDLVNDTDCSLIRKNGAEVRYNVVFHKRNPRGNETNMVKAVSDVWTNHQEAFTAAQALDIKEERYVDGRLVQNASPSNAQVHIVIQMENADTDMLDYEVWDLGPHVNEGWQIKSAEATPILMELQSIGDIDKNAGLFEFTGNLNHTYILVYSKTFKLRFIDTLPATDHKFLDDITRNYYQKIKIRKKESLADPMFESYYRMDYDTLKMYADGETPGNLVTPFDDIYGVTFTYINWSKKNMPSKIQVFDSLAPVNRSFIVYAYYENNRPQVQKAREDLTNLIPIAEGFKDHPYLKSGELERLVVEIANARNILERRRGRLENGIDPLRMANYPELQVTIDALLEMIEEFNKMIKERTDSINTHTGGMAGGGAPGKGIGTKLRPLQFAEEFTFMLGVDGKWEVNPYTGKFSFVLNGGYPLNNRWGKIEHMESDGKTITEWYCFDESASLITGWHKDKKDGKWYYLAETKDANEGKMQIGWRRDPNDGNWYFLDRVTGEMYIGWHKIGNHWYYFNTYASQPSYQYINGQWVFINQQEKPYGALYMSDTTPDGYKVNHDGEWIQ